MLLCICGCCDNGTATSLSSLFASSYAICILCKRPIFKTEVLLPEVRQASSWNLMETRSSEASPNRHHITSCHFLDAESLGFHDEICCQKVVAKRAETTPSGNLLAGRQMFNPMNLIRGPWILSNSNVIIVPIIIIVIIIYVYVYHTSYIEFI
jgi:hypothetical protein